MTTVFKMNMLFKDRVGIVSDISALLARHQLNILSMEVRQKADEADLYFMVQCKKDTLENKELIDIMSKVPDLIGIRFVRSMPHEDRENHFRVVLDNISEGVISINTQGKITTINKVARQMFDCGDQSFTGKDIAALALPDPIIHECLKGKKYNNIKKNIINAGGRYQYFVTGRPISDAAGRTIGAVEIAKDMQEIRMLASSISQPGLVTFTDIIGEHPAMQQAITFAEKIAGTGSIVSLRGESGTGKELFARAIHTSGKQPGPFIPVNCAALPETLLESELFGYEGGAFTGAKTGGKPGLFEMASNGTLFLDEIAEMPAGPQAKILRVIQEKHVRRIGGNEERPVHTRIITATNRNLEQMVEEKRFRRDLYYRINVLPIHIPALRDRVEDIKPLAEHFLFQLSTGLGKGNRFLTKGALSKLCSHIWPGNVRELKNVIERAAILSEEGGIDEENILFSFEINKMNPPVGKTSALRKKSDKTLPALIGTYETQIIKRALADAGSIRQAAGKLGVSHTTLRNKIKKYRIHS